MPTYRYTGTVPKRFPTLALGRVVEPGDLLTTVDPVSHPELERVTASAERRRVVAPEGERPDPPVKES